MRAGKEAQKMTRLLLAAVLLVAVAVAAAYATAAIESKSATVIVACRNDTNGILRVIADTGSCRTHETALSWNMQGPQGPPGPPGASGGALGFAHVLADGTIDRSRTSQNVLTVSRTSLAGSSPSIPLYCFELTAAPMGATANTQISPVQVVPPPPAPPSIGLAGAFISATVDQTAMAGLGCPNGTEAAVAMGGGGTAGLPFYVVFN
jgi:hypothetical protein